MMITAGQSFYIAASAESNPAQAETLVAFAQPRSVTMANYKTALEEETRLVEAQNHVIPGIAIYAHNFGGDEASRLAKDGVIIGSNSVDNYIDLQSGNVLLTPDKDIVVGTNKGKISIAAGATVFVSESNKDVVIYDLLQTKPKQVSIIVNKQKLVMEPGRMLVISGQNIDGFEKLEMNCHCVTYRNAKAVNMNVNGVKTFLAEFSIASALVTIQPLQRLTVSSHKQDQIALERILKGAVILGDFAMSTTQPDPASVTAVQQSNSAAVDVASVGSSQ